MRIPRVHISQTVRAATTITLCSEVSHYLCNVLRLRAGRELVVFDGRGGEYSARLLEADRKRARVEVLAAHPDRGISPLNLELAVAVSRGERFDWVIQKATELGVNRIRPIWSARVEVKLPAARLERKLSHWQRVAVSACEQSGRTRLPELTAPCPLRDYLDSPAGEERLLLHPGEGKGLDAVTAGTVVSLLIGPEGGWEDAEVDAALDAGFRLWQLGPRILRAETAPVAALAVLQHRFGDI